MYRLRHDSYVGAKLIEMRNDQEMKDEFDESPYATTFVAILPEIGTIVGTIRICIDSPHLKLPSDQDGLSEELNQLRAEQKKLAEIGRFCFAPNYRENSKRRLITMGALAIRQGYLNGVDSMIIEVAAHHAKFYERIFHAQKLLDLYSDRYTREAVGLIIDTKTVEISEIGRLLGNTISLPKAG